MTASPIPLLLLLSTGAGLAILVGAVLGLLSERAGARVPDVLNHSVLAFGGGALMSAVGLVLAPDALEILPTWLATGLFVFGGLVFMGVDAVLHRLGAPLSQVIATLLDFVPEAIVLGAVILARPAMAVALGVIIAAQNLPEGYAAYRQIRASPSKGLVARRPLPVLALCVLVGPLAALFGFYVCSEMDPLLGVIMSFCAGGILFIVFRDIAPAANLERSGWPSFAAVLGFGVGLVGLGLAH